MSAAAASPVAGAQRLGRQVMEGIAGIALIAAPPVLRIALALPFLRSGLTRWDGFPSLSIGTLYLFENQFKLHILGGVYDFPAPEAVALVTAIAEILFPILLLLGLATRLSAMALLAMTGVIQLVFPEAWANYHLNWAAMAMAILALGPGELSLDNRIAGWRRGER